MEPAVAAADEVKASEPGEDPQNVVARVINLPLVSSACEAVSSVYCSTRDNLPLLKGVMDAAESGVRTLGAAAATSSKPLLDIMEPQLSTVNTYAMKGLDRMEESLPILQTPADKVVSDTVGLVRQSVSGAKDAVVGAVMGGVEMTRSAVSGGIDSVMGTSVGQMVSSGMGAALTRSENWVDQNLPITEQELAALAEAPSGEVMSSSGRSSYFVRLGKLSSKVRQRALELSRVRARDARAATQSTVTQIASTLELLELTRAATAHQLGGATEQLQQRLLVWRREQEETRETHKPEEPLESSVLSMVHGLSSQLRTTCSGVVSSAQGLPGAVQDQLTSARRSAEELQSSLSSSASITPVLLERSRHHLSQVQQSLDGVMDYLLNNTPLNWMVGPFAPQLVEKEERR